MTITRSRTLSLINLTVDGTQMETVHSTRYIAVTISSDLTQGLHITNTYKKAKQQLGLTYRKFHQASHQVRSKLYSNIVLPKLEYCSSVWDPHQVKYISKLESVQKFGCHVITKQWKSDNPTLLNHLQKSTLQSNRKQHNVL